MYVSKKLKQILLANVDLATSLAISFTGFVIGRALKGISLGVISGLMPLYIKEVFRPIHAEYVLTSVQSTIPFGILMTSTMAAVGYSGGSNPKLSFNHCWLFVALPVSPAMITCFLIRPSPRDILDRPEQVSALLTQIHGPEDSELVKRRLEVEADQTSSPLQDLKTLCSLKYRSRFLKAIMTQALVQLSGINVISKQEKKTLIGKLLTLVYYISYICHSTWVYLKLDVRLLTSVAGLSPESTAIVSLLLYACNFLVTASSALIINRVNKPNLIRFGCLLLGLVHGIMFIVMLGGHNVESFVGNRTTVWMVERGSGLCVLAFCFVFVTIFGLMISGPSMVYTSEVIPNGVHRVGVGLAISVGWMSNFFLAVLGPTMLSVMKHFTFATFCLICLTVFVCTTWLDEDAPICEEKAEEEVRADIV
jgi:hypothetical protein